MANRAEFNEFNFFNFVSLIWVKADLPELD